MEKRKLLVLIASLLSILNILIVIFFLDPSLCVINEGMAFGIKVNSLGILSLLSILVLLLVYLKSKSSLRYNLGAIAILGLGNLIERLIRGSICDYIRLGALSVNLIDISITVIVAVSLIYVIKETYEDNSSRR